MSKGTRRPCCEEGCSDLALVWLDGHSYCGDCYGPAYDEYWLRVVEPAEKKKLRENMARDRKNEPREPTEEEIYGAFQEEAGGSTGNPMGGE